MAAKVNYTQANISDIVAAVSVESNKTFESQKLIAQTLATKLGKTSGQILGKLSWLSRQQGKGYIVRTDNNKPLYIKKVYKAKTGSIVASKESLVADLEKLLSAPSSSMESLTKANKSVILSLKGWATRQLNMIAEYESILEYEEIDPDEVLTSMKLEQEAE